MLCSLDDRYERDMSRLDDADKFNSVSLVEIENSNYGLSLEVYSDDELPTVSILTITHNREYIFDIAVRNWSKFVYPESKIEWVIFDDSTKQPLVKSKLPADKRIKYFHVDNKIPTIGAKRNKGVELCSNQIVVFMDDDDYYFPDSVMNRVLVLLQYNKKVVGSVSLNCVNIIDNTSFITGGGLFVYKNGDKSIICGEASLAFYRSFWEEQKFDEIVRSEEVVDFLRNRTDDFINLHGSFVMIALTHGSNMSNRCLFDSINVHNFLDELDMNSVNFIDNLRLSILMLSDDNKKALEFYKKIKAKGLGVNAIYKKINGLSINIQKSPIIKELRREYPLFKVPPPRSMNILYFYHCNNTHIVQVDRKYPDVHVLQMYSFARVFSAMNYNVCLYLYTDDEYTIDNFKVKPYWKYTPGNACEITLVYREYGLLDENINTTKLYYFTTDKLPVAKKVSNLTKCSEIWVDNIENVENYKDKIKIVKLLDLSTSITEKVSLERENDTILVLDNLTEMDLVYLRANFRKIYTKLLPRSVPIEGITYVNNIYSINPEYILVGAINNVVFTYGKYMKIKLCKLVEGTIQEHSIGDCCSISVNEQISYFVSIGF
jgi:hypothetical protein